MLRVGPSISLVCWLTLTASDPESDLESILSAVPAQARAGLGIRGIMEATEKAGLLDEVLGDALLSSQDPSVNRGGKPSPVRAAGLSGLTGRPKTGKRVVERTRNRYNETGNRPGSPPAVSS